MDPREPATDETLLRKFTEGDAEAFEALVRRFERPLFNFILRSVRDPDRSEELLQEVFLKVVQRASEFQGGSKVSTWIYTIARNLCIDTSRKMVFWRHRSLDAPSGDDPEGPTMMDRVVASTPLADREVIGGDLKERIARAV